MSDAGYGSRILRLRRTILLLFLKRSLEQVVLIQLFLTRSSTGVERLLKSFLARNERVAALDV